MNGKTNELNDTQANARMKIQKKTLVSLLNKKKNNCRLRITSNACG